VPLDTDALVALSDLAARPSGGRRSRAGGAAPSGPTAPRGDQGDQGESRPRSGPAVPPVDVLVRRRVAMLAAGSAIAGLALGVLLPAPGSATTVRTAAAPHRSAVVAAPALLLAASASPFAAVPVRAATTTAHTATRSPAGAPRTTPPVSGAAAAPARTVAPARSTTSRVLAAAAPLVGAVGPSSPYVPTRPLPARSGAGRRIVYAETAAHLWVVGDDGAVVRDYAVTGRVGRPKPSVYHVYSKSTVATNPGEKLRFEYMVRFAVGLTGARIGFHTIPRYVGGAPIQSESQLGRAIGSGGCVRQSRADAVWLYGWSRVGDEVVVLR